jgi:hypothetical protein
MNRKLIALMVFLALVLSACSAAATQAPAAPAAPDQFGGRDLNYSTAPSSGPSSTGGSSGKPGLADSTANAAADRMVIKNASLSIVVDTPANAMTTISDMAVEMGGFVVSSNSFKTKGETGADVPQANVTVRIPADKLNDALAQIRALVKNPVDDIRNETVTGQDITKDYTDLQSRLTNLLDTETQLQRIQAAATKTEDVLSVFNQLTNIRQQIEQIKGQMQYYEQAASLSAISVEILSSAGVAPLSIAGWQPLGVARDALQTLINVGKFLVNALIWIVIVFVPLGLVIFFPTRWVRRFMRRKNLKLGKNQPAAPSDFPELK